MRPSTEIDKMAVALVLYRLRRAGRIPRLWIDRGVIRIQIAPDHEKRLGWRQAARLAAGEPLASVLQPLRPRPHDWEAWKKRRREYLREKGAYFEQ